MAISVVSREEEMLISRRSSRRAWAAKNPDYSKKWNALNPEKRRLYTDRYLAKLAALEKPDETTLKQCSKCNSHKPRSDFNTHKNCVDGRYPVCRSCLRYAGRQKKFGLSPQAFHALWDKQDGKCGVCKNTLTNTKTGCAVDHDHRTNIVRGLLCQACNLAIGHLKDNPDLCIAAASYLTVR